MGLAHVLEESDISPEAMVDAMRSALALPEPVANVLDLDGADGTARILEELYREQHADE